ncbi:swr complex subunit [Madurella fahalii]|uniref:SWR1-complex protein 5 n=1 Tax=Madurella fahalii TaxID=1157608 RepID=A0ABQ0GSE9_9PEZI
MSLELDHEEDYVSEEDSDFAPENAPAEDSVSDDDEAANVKKETPGKRKLDASDVGAEDDVDFENSGDEAIIEKGKKRRKKPKKKDGADEDEDDGGEGGMVKTRSMRAVEKAERRAAAASGPVTIDVDALWAQMNSEPVGKRGQDESATTQPSTDVTRPSSQPQLHAKAPTEESDFIRIKRTYNFAGKVHTEEKLVPRDSAEAKLYLAENDPNSNSAEDSSLEQKRMPRKAFRSRFEPVVAEGMSQRADLNLGMSARLQARELANAKKLNTVEKSRMDWAGFVDREGIKDELELAGRSKHSYAARQDFLARSEAVREEDARRARMAGRA